MVGPRLDLFEKPDEERLRKPNAITESVKSLGGGLDEDFLCDDEYSLPITHEVALPGHSKSI